MNRQLLWRTVLARLGRYKLKTLFMGLGITIGVLATVLLQTVVVSIKSAFTAFIERAYPAESVVVMAGSGFMGGGTGRDNLRLADVLTIAGATGITEWDPVIYAGSRDVAHAGKSVSVGVQGYSEKAESVRRRSVRDGEFFTADDVKQRATVALIGATTAAKLFAGESPVGQQLFIDNVPFAVRGVLDRVGVDPHGNDQDNAIYVPYTTLMDNLLKRNYVSGVSFVVRDRGRMAAVTREIGDILRQRHQIGEGQDDDFSVITPDLMRELLDRSFRTFNLFVPLIAGTAFAISAAVILSIMQISVKGRVKEIGLRKAVGARSRDVQLQIVLEVLVVAAAASLVGLLLAQLGGALLAPALAAKFGVKQVAPDLAAWIVAVGAALATGLLGALLPARRAAKLDPVAALR